MKEKDQKTTASTERPPVVAVMGHIDHGKSTLLDYIRKTNVTDKEAGGITQRLSAYEAEIEIKENGKQSVKKITFLDTPGHEAFLSMRQRGAKVADIAVLVVSAEDGVKPQTLEALKCIKEGETPFIVAINKIDKPGANIEKVKQNLAEHEVFVEGWGGSVPSVSISAKTGENVSELLEVISLQAELEGFTGDSAIKAEGFIIESSLNPKQGVSATLIIKDGTLKTGMFVASEGSFAPVRTIENFKGENVKEASFSSPVKIMGWNENPKVGGKFKTFNTKEEACLFAQKKLLENKNPTSDNKPDERAVLTLVVKADTYGTLEAVEHELLKLANDKITPKIVSKGVGSISESDIKTANIKKSLIVGFNVGTPKSAELLALREKISIKTFNVIYDLIDFVKEKVKEATPITQTEVVAGSAKVLRTFSKNKDKQVIGGKMLEGEIKSGGTVKIIRRESQIGEGKVKEVQTQKIKTSAIKTGDEFGMMIDSKTEIVEGDTLRALEWVKSE